VYIFVLKEFLALLSSHRLYEDEATQIALVFSQSILKSMQMWHYGRKSQIMTH